MKEDVSRKKARTVGREKRIVEERKGRKRSAKNRTEKSWAHVFSHLPC